jgi:hypothetical protein
MEPKHITAGKPGILDLFRGLEGLPREFGFETLKMCSNTVGSYSNVHTFWLVICK